MAPLVSALVKNHTTYIEYPCKDLLAANERLVLIHAENADKRYEPLPLIPDVGVTHHAGRDNASECSIESFTRALFDGRHSLKLPKPSDNMPRTYPLDGLYLNREDRLMVSRMPEAERELVRTERNLQTKYEEKASEMYDKQSSGLARLQQDMSLITQTTGTTMLSVAPHYKLYLILDANGTEVLRIPEKLEYYVRVERETEHIWGVGETQDTKTVYQFKFREMDESTCTAQWFIDLRDLIYRRSDRAVRHVRRITQRAGIPLPVDPWMPRRRIRGEKVLKELTNPVSIKTLDEGSCLCCTEDFDEKENKPVALPCNQSSPHIICFGCVVEMLQAQGPEKLCCPFCRSKVLADETLLIQVKFGLDGKNAYRYDDRYSNWENHERSIADLDRRLAKDSKEKITVSSRLLTNIFYSLLSNARGEPEESTPLHMQPALRPECTNLRKAASAAFANLNGVNLEVKTIYKMLLKAIYDQLFRDMLQAGMLEHWPADVMENEMQEPSPEHLGMSLGFQEFAERTLSRAFQFVSLRKCECKAATDAPYLIHYHGLRRFYTPPEEEKMQKRPLFDFKSAE
jgi:hypothetical protein